MLSVWVGDKSPVVFVYVREGRVSNMYYERMGGLAVSSFVPRLLSQCQDELPSQRLLSSSGGGRVKGQFVSLSKLQCHPRAREGKADGVRVDLIRQDCGKLLSPSSLP